MTDSSDNAGQQNFGMIQRTVLLVAAFICLLLASTARAADWAAPRQAVPAPQNRAFKGVIELTIDVRDLRRRIVKVHQRLPVQSKGTLTLLYPRWEPGSHGPTTEVQRLAGLSIRAGARVLPWHRDALDPNAFHVNVPPETGHVDVEFQYLAPLGQMGLITPDIVNLQWQHLLVYPAGFFARRIPVVATVQLPDGFLAVSSLRETRRLHSEVHFDAVALDVLLDSPVIAAPHLHQRTIVDGPVPVRVTYIASNAERLQGAESLDDTLRRVVQQTAAVFGAPPFPSFDFLVMLSDRLPGPGGLEHARSAEITLPPDFLPATQASAGVIDLFAHEYVHAWNGKHVQPRGHWTPTPNIPMDNSLLWLYEGQTEFWGRVIGARAGLRSVTDTLAALSVDAASMANRPGRRWKSLADSSLDPVTMPGGRGVSWQSWQRRKDYYAEGVLLWLDVDGLLREHSGGKHGLDDFAAAFFRVTGLQVKQYDFDQICAALSKLADYDWHGYLIRRVQGLGDDGLLDGLKRSGYRLAYRVSPSDYFKRVEESDGVPDFSYSIGLAVNKSGTVSSVRWDGPAFAAGLIPGAKITQVANEPFSLERLRAAVAAGAPSGIDLTFDVEGQRERVSVRYSDGVRYPALERDETQADRLLHLLAPR